MNGDCFSDLFSLSFLDTDSREKEGENELSTKTRWKLKKTDHQNRLGECKAD